MTSHHIVPMIESRYPEDVDHWHTPDDMRPLDGTWTQYRVHSRYARAVINISMLYIGPNGKGRREHQGPILPGPYAGVVPLVSVLSAHPQARPTGTVELADGDIVEFRTAGGSQAFRLSDGKRFDYPQLTPITVTYAHDNCQQCIDQVGWAHAHATATGSIGADAEHVEHTGHGAIATHRAMYRRL